MWLLQSGRFGKLNKRVTFPMNLDLTPYMSSTDGSDLYDLYAVVVHLDMMNASFFGHYICYIKGSRGNWYKIDDCKVYFHLNVVTTQINVIIANLSVCLILFAGYDC